MSFLRHQVQDFVRGDYLRSKYAISNHPYALGGNRVVTQFTQRCNSSRNGDRSCLDIAPYLDLGLSPDKRSVRIDRLYPRQLDQDHEERRGAYVLVRMKRQPIGVKYSSALRAAQAISGNRGGFSITAQSAAGKANRRDSNSGPFAPYAGALPNCATLRPYADYTENTHYFPETERSLITDPTSSQVSGREAVVSA